MAEDGDGRESTDGECKEFHPDKEVKGRRVDGLRRGRREGRIERPRSDGEEGRASTRPPRISRRPLWPLRSTRLRCIPPLPSCRLRHPEWPSAFVPHQQHTTLPTDRPASPGLIQPRLTQDPSTAPDPDPQSPTQLTSWPSSSRGRAHAGPHGSCRPLISIRD